MTANPCLDDGDHGKRGTIHQTQGEAPRATVGPVGKFAGKVGQYADHCWDCAHWDSNGSAANLTEVS